MATETISTPRLILRSAMPSDLDTLYERIFSDAEVMRFVLGGGALTQAKTAEFFASAFDHEGTGLKLGVLVEKESSEIIGFSGLMECRVLGEKDYEIGFVLARSVWGKHYATEIGYGQLNYGFGTVGCARLLAQAAPENLVSIAVLEKIGMVFHCKITSERGTRCVYVAYRPASPSMIP
jgi:RimJ/RimL family protein N-acetyltransferase